MRELCLQKKFRRRNHQTKHSQMHVTPCKEGNLHTKESQDPEQRQRQRRRFLMSGTRNSKMNAREESLSITGQI